MSSDLYKAIRREFSWYMGLYRFIDRKLRPEKYELTLDKMRGLFENLETSKE